MNGIAGWVVAFGGIWILSESNGDYLKIIAGLLALILSALFRIIGELQQRKGVSA